MFAMRNGWLLLLGLLGCHIVQAQQLPPRSPFGATDFVWNPAMTAFEEEWEAGITHNQQWVGFEDAPQTTTFYGQYPFLKQNASMGGYLQLDEIRPIRNNVLALTYAYKLTFGPRKRRRRKKGFRKDAQLALGMMISMNHIFVNGADILAQDMDDLLIPLGETDVFKPNMGLGAFFASRPTGPQQRSYFFAGLGANQLLPQSVTLRESQPTGDLKRTLHGNATIGYNSAGEKLTITPSLWLNYASENLNHSQFNITVERPLAFWGGLSYSFNQTLAFQAGYILPNSMADGDQLRIGLMGSFNFGDFGPPRGLGYAFYLGYRLKA